MPTLNVCFNIWTARVPASPLQDEEALQEVQETPQETFPLSIGQ